jgi:hypothetical protein
VLVPTCRVAMFEGKQGSSRVLDRQLHLTSHHEAVSAHACGSTPCNMAASSGPEGEEQDMSDDGDDAGDEDGPEDEMQNDAIHTFQGHSGVRQSSDLSTCQLAHSMLWSQAPEFEVY